MKRGWSWTTPWVMAQCFYCCTAAMRFREIAADIIYLLQLEQVGGEIPEPKMENTQGDISEGDTTVMFTNKVNTDCLMIS